MAACLPHSGDLLIRHAPGHDPNVIRQRAKVYEALFTDELGVRLTPKAATNAFARLARKAGIVVTSLHSIRHTAGTHLIASGIDVRTAAAVLGHADATTTLRVYSHTVEGAEHSAIDALEARLLQARGQG